MKYIRTKDGRFLEEKNIDIMENWFDDKLFKPCKKPKYWITKLEILSQADTIEELFDEFVVEYQTKKKNVFHLFNEAREDYIKCPIDMGGFSLYGAIWTSKGLIYKAKMKGVLPNGEIDWELL